MTLTSAESGLCLGGGGANKSEVARIEQANCSGAARQRWQLRAVSEGHAVVNLESGMCLEIPLHSTRPGEAVIQAPCDARRLGQVFSLHDGALRSASSGQCLDAAAARGEGSASIVQNACTQSPAQRFLMSAAAPAAAVAAAVAAPSSAQALVAQHSQKCLDVEGGSSASETRIIQYGCHLAKNQQWVTQPIGGGLEWRNAQSGKCLTVRSKVAGAVVVQATCDARAEQAFAREGNTLRSAHSGMCVDITGGSAADLAAVIQWPCNGGGNQAFTSRVIDGAAGPRIVFRNLMSIHRTAVFNGQTWTFPESKIEPTITAFTQTWPELVRQMTNGRVKLENFAVVTDDPITRWGTGFEDSLPQIDGTGNWRSRVGATGSYDVHFVMNPRPQAAMWALGGGFCCDNANRVGWTFVPQRDDLGINDDQLAGWTHEWLHVMGEAFYTDRLRLARVPGVHDTGIFGYERDAGGRVHWQQWYKDYLNRQVSGSGQTWGLGEDAWRLGTARDYLRSGRP